VVEDRATAKRARGGISRRAPLVSDELLSKLGTTGGRKGGKPENCDKSNDPRGGSRAMTQLEKGENRPKPEQDAKGRFVAGNSGNGGRPKGTRNELSEAFIADLCENWRKHGVSVIDKIRASQPVDYVKIIAAVVGRDANGGGDQPSVSIVNVITGVRG
jgi:hypothetical protein